MEKIKVSQDFLKDYLQEHDMTKKVFAERMGVSVSIVSGCFLHSLNRHGKPLKFSRANIIKLNQALEQIANELRQKVIIFGSSETFTNKRGTTYDPGTLERIHEIGNYFIMNQLTERLLGWSKTRCSMVLSIKSSPVYGNVTKDDVDRLNAELLAIAGVLGSYEVVADEDKD